MFGLCVSAHLFSTLINPCPCVTMSADAGRNMQNYLEGYHALIRYLQKSFKNKSDTLRIIRALSIYRPSLIALQMQLTPEDEVFVERSFQRTLIEMEKLISFSGTPTVVWRRTGEIMLVGTEFTLLSEWKREDLLWKSDAVAASGANTNGNGTPPNPAVVAINGKGGNSRQKPKRRYIFEIFDQPSTVEYYESFAAHAFESSSTVSASEEQIDQPLTCTRDDDRPTLTWHACNLPCRCALCRPSCRRAL